MPIRLWESFRNLLTFDSSDITNANFTAKQSAGIDFEQLRKIYFQVICSTMETSEFEVLSGNATFGAASDCVTNRLDLMADKYWKAWEKFGVILPLL